MAIFPSLGSDAAVPSILKISPDAVAPLMELHEAIMRAPSPLSVAERELIATYVSGLNQCRYCYGVHSEAAKAYGIAPKAMVAMMDDLNAAELDERIKPILRLAHKLTLLPAGVNEADAQAVYDAGWDEKALHDAIMVVCCFNFMNRLLEGHGVHGSESLFKQRGLLLKEYGYLPLIKLVRSKGPG